ncbi:MULTISPECIES: protein phosphatase CheZ [Asticcacaulis]|uniref:protein phosphatase CheZ n=1 Tax=Asticcacaulis TaxID=76890 RepID=UPI001FD92F45|nr:MULTISPECIES: protein phosphatase CheZ [Asticcacaulis]MBP2160657.1 chemotaxis regulatin CheY-phosphate phosphatase CheZ [Asticcacaulis solisilvae]MDR6801702.1 chemotaxis regulatin CheY-phosphate phosphatase CheZ [Asticcacaulis sp. BE141]
MPAEKRDAIDAGDFDPAMVGELEPKLINLMQQSEALVALMRGFFQQLDKRRSEEFSIIAGYIAKAKEEIREMRPHDISQDRIPTAGAELEAITRDTENATHAIMNSAEAIMGYDGSDPDYKSKVDDEVMKIFEACSFQDITGQRVSKVVNVLKQIEERVGRLASTLGIDDGAPKEMSAEEKRRHDLLLNGPAIGGPETKQDAIDAMFDEAPAAPAVTPDALAAKAPESKPEPAPVAKAPEPAPAPKPQPAPAAKAPEAPKPAAPAPAPAPAPAAEEKNSQDDIDALFDIAPEDMGKTNSQDDIDALFD